MLQPELRTSRVQSQRRVQEQEQPDLHHSWLSCSAERRAMERKHGTTFMLLTPSHCPLSPPPLNTLLLRCQHLIFSFINLPRIFHSHQPMSKKKKKRKIQSQEFKGCLKELLEKNLFQFQHFLILQHHVYLHNHMLFFFSWRSVTPVLKTKIIQELPQGSLANLSDM